MECYGKVVTGNGKRSIQRSIEAFAWMLFAPHTPLRYRHIETSFKIAEVLPTRSWWFIHPGDRTPPRLLTFRVSGRSGEVIKISILVGGGRDGNHKEGISY